MKIITHLLLFLALPLLAVAVRAADAPPADVRIMFDDIKVNGHLVRLAFDTGASDIILFRPVAERLHLKIYDPPADAKISAGETLASHTDPLEIQIGTDAGTMTPTGTNAGTIKATDWLSVVDMPAGVAPDIDGVIGWNPLSDDYFVLDAANSKMTVVAPRKPPEPAAAWQQLPVRKNSEMLVLETPGSKDQPGAILIDTGDSGGVNLAPARWREWRAAHPAAPTTMNAYFTPGAGLVVREVSWAKELTVGPLTLTDVPVQEADETAAAMVPGHVATLGMAAVSRQDIVIDGKNEMVYFARKQIPARPFQHNRLGAVFTPSDMQHDPLEAHVAAGSPAETADIRNGDELLKIDGRDVTKWRTDPTVEHSPWDLPAGTKFALTLKRGDKEIVVTVTLRDILGPGAVPTETKAPPQKP